MNKRRALGGTVLVVTLAVFPVVGALGELGAGLAAVDRMHARADRAGAAGTSEVVGTYEVDPSTMTAGLRLHEVRVRR
jgi:hypothetical protein